MSTVSVSTEGFVVEARLIADSFGIAPETVQDEMRDSKITSRCETGVDEDKGRWRLTFYRDGRALRLTVNANGDVLSQASFPVAAQGQRPDPGAEQEP